MTDEPSFPLFEAHDEAVLSDHTEVPTEQPISPSLSSHGRGVLIAGLQPRCGKTALTGALTVVLNNLGFTRVQAFKPVAFQSNPQDDSEPSSLANSADQDYLNALTHQAIGSATTTVAAPDQWTTHQWQQMINHLITGPYPYLVETPGTLASPWYWRPPHTLHDTVSLANNYEFDVLLVGAVDDQLGEQLRLGLAFLEQHHLKPLGVVLIHHQEALSPQAQLALSMVDGLCHSHQIPLLGQLPYDPYIDTAQFNAGRSVALVEECLDLLPFQLQSSLTKA